ncbi:MAG TPA: cytochrome c oxidase subunit 3 [Rhizomicrobium sp.]|nr:cytochrome c oxidase subunit 3 [Rhizomicrobium sp.]
MSDELVIRQKLPVGAIDTRATGWWGMIFLIFTEASLFGYLLFSYFYLGVQPQDQGMWPEGGVPKLELALPDTFVLIFSSLAIYWGERGRRLGSNGRLVAGLAIGLVLGAIFVVIQFFEWKAKPFSLGSSAYSSLYYTITGFHMAHVICGLIVLATLLAWSAEGYFDRVRYAPVQIGSLYWHFVDAVWIVIFFAIYVTPRFG